MAAETARGRRKAPIDAEQKRQDRQNAKDILQAMRWKDERRFSEMLRKAGIQDGDERWTKAWEIFQAFCGRY